MCTNCLVKINFKVMICDNISTKSQWNKDRKWKTQWNRDKKFRKKVQIEHPARALWKTNNIMNSCVLNINPNLLVKFKQNDFERELTLWYYMKVETPYNK